MFRLDGVDPVVEEVDGCVAVFDQPVGHCPLVGGGGAVGAAHGQVLDLDLVWISGREINVCDWDGDDCNGEGEEDEEGEREKGGWSRRHDC